MDMPKKSLYIQIVANGFDEDVAITEWVAENKDKTFMFDIIIDN